MGSCYAKDVAKFLPFCSSSISSSSSSSSDDAKPALSLEKKKKPSGFDCLQKNTSKACDKHDECSWWV
jgi:hypothetical protein